MSIRAHIVAEDGEILNTVMVERLDPGMCDASIGGGRGDRIVDGAVVRKAPPPISIEDHNEPILAKLAALDAASIRPLREGDKMALDEIERQAAELRQQLRKD